MRDWGEGQSLLERGEVSWGEKLSHDIPGARRLEPLDAGHLVMEDRPAEFARFVSDFLSQAAAPSPPPEVEARS